MLIEERAKGEGTIHLPKLVEPNNRLDLVVDGGGGGFCSCDAVGARDWRIE